MSSHLKAHVYGILEPGGEDRRYFDPFILSLIVLNVAAVVLVTVESIGSSYATFFYAFKLFSVAVFSLEYILRIWPLPIQSCRPALSDQAESKDALEHEKADVMMPLCRLQ
jgi:hypothetical protein